MSLIVLRASPYQFDLDLIVPQFLLEIGEHFLAAIPLLSENPARS